MKGSVMIVALLSLGALTFLALSAGAVKLSHSYPIKRLSYRANHRLFMGGFWLCLVSMLFCLGFTVKLVDDNTDREHAAALARIHPLVLVLNEWEFAPAPRASFDEPMWYIFNKEGTGASVQIELANGETGLLHFHYTRGWLIGCFTPKGFQPIVNKREKTLFEATSGCEYLEGTAPE